MPESWRRAGISEAAYRGGERRPHIPERTYTPETGSVISLRQPGKFAGPLTGIPRRGARQLLAHTGGEVPMARELALLGDTRRLMPPFAVPAQNLDSRILYSIHPAGNKAKFAGHQADLWISRVFHAVD
jgi:hypothetical protein